MMRSNKSGTILLIVIIILGVLLALIPTIILPVCDGNLELVSGKLVPMKCFWMSRAQIAMGIVVVGAGVTALFTTALQSRLTAAFFVIISGIVSILVATTLIGVCANETMACHTGSLPGVIVVDILIILVAVILAATSAASMKREKEFMKLM